MLFGKEIRRFREYAIGLERLCADYDYFSTITSATSVINNISLYTTTALCTKYRNWIKCKTPSTPLLYSSPSSLCSAKNHRMIFTYEK